MDKKSAVQFNLGNALKTGWMELEKWLSIDEWKNCIKSLSCLCPNLPD